MRRHVCVSLVVTLVGLLLPLVAHAHPTIAAPVAPLPGPDVAAASLRAAPAAGPPAVLVLALAAGILLAASGYRPRRAFGLALVALLAIFAAEAAVHSVHHLGHDANRACAIAAAAGHLTVALDDGAPALEAPLAVSASVADSRWSPPAAPSSGPDPARAPPAPIA